MVSRGSLGGCWRWQHSTEIVLAHVSPGGGEQFSQTTGNYSDEMSRNWSILAVADPCTHVPSLASISRFWSGEVRRGIYTRCRADRKNWVDRTLYRALKHTWPMFCGCLHDPGFSNFFTNRKKLLHAETMSSICHS